MKPRHFLAAAAALSYTLATAASAAPEAIEVSKEDFPQMPGGKEADGIVGDFILRNDLVEAVISQNAPHRKANMGTFWGEGGNTPGCLYDLSLRGANNDQITIFSPLGQRGDVSYVRIAEDCEDGEAAIETVTTATKGNGLARHHRYSIRDGMPGVLITSTLKNETQVAITFKGKDTWTNFASKGNVGRVSWADAIDPADRTGYAFAPEPGQGDELESGALIEPGATLSYSRFLAIGSSPAQAIGHIAERHGETGTISGRLTGPDGGAVTSATIYLQSGKDPSLKLYTDGAGNFTTSAKPGTYSLRIVDMGRETITREIDLAAGAESKIEPQLAAASKIRFDVKLYDGRDTPCKVQFVINDENPDIPRLDLGPENRAHGCANQYHSETGQFEVAVPPGKYMIIITRGIEFGAFSRAIEIAPGETKALPATLIRQVQTPGWVSTDFHNHSTPSGDNTCGTDDRLINLAAEHIEFAPTTEHNRLFDWSPHLERLGLDDEIATVPGLELTGSGAHINAFPFTPDPTKQDSGAPLWSKDPRLTALTLRNHQGAEPDRWIHLNHPDLAENFADADGDGRVDGGYVNLGKMIDAMETQNGNYQNILHNSPYIVSKNIGPKGRVTHAREFIWLQLLNQGHRIWAIAVADAHKVFDNGVGGWRTYVRSSTDDPAEIDWREMSRNAKAGQMIISNGPYLEVIAGSNTLAGGALRSTGKLKLKVKVQCADWLNIDRVQILVNGHQRKDLNFTRESHPQWFGIGTVKFDRVLDIPLSQDSHIIAVAYGHDSNLLIGYGNSPQSNMHPCAYNNPIFVDVDGGGFSPSRDTLGYALPVKGQTVDQIRELLKD